MVSSAQSRASAPDGGGLTAAGADVIPRVTEYDRPPDGSLLFVEIVLPGANQPSPGELMDLIMLVNSRRRQERTLKDYRDFLVADHRVPAGLWGRASAARLSG